MHRHPVFSSFPAITTANYLLREITPADAEAIFASRGDPEVMAFYGKEPHQTVEESEQLIAWYRQEFAEGLSIRWGIARRDDNKIIGTCGFHHFSFENRRGEIGYELIKPYWGRGVMLETLRQIIPFGFNSFDLNRIQAFVEPPNTRSRRLLQKLGFTEEGILREYEFSLGKPCDLVLLALLKRDYR